MIFPTKKFRVRPGPTHPLPYYSRIFGIVFFTQPLSSSSDMFLEVSIYVICYLGSRPGAIPPSMIPTPIPAHLFDSDSDSDSSHLGYDSDSDSESNTIFMNDSDSDSIPTPALLIF